MAKQKSSWYKPGMPARLIKVLLVLALIAGAVSYLFFMNPGSVSFVLGPGKTVQTPVAFFSIVVFCLGAVFAGILSFVFSFRRLLEDWQERRRDRIWKSHIQLLIQGREFLASRSWLQARTVFERMIRENPENIVARMQLVETYLSSGDSAEALRILDEARQTEKRNVELLFRGAEINGLLGNFTAALDNVALVLSKEPGNKRALEEAARYAEALGRLEEAVGYLKTLLRYS